MNELRKDIKADKQPEKFVKNGGYVELSKSAVIEEATNTINDLIEEAYKKAIQENIKANTVVLNKTFAKVNNFCLPFMGGYIEVPPMICGLEVLVSDELPVGCDFAVFEAPHTRTERIIAEAKTEVAREIFEEIEKSIEKHYNRHIFGVEELSDVEQEAVMNFSNDVSSDLAKLKKKYIGE